MVEWCKVSWELKTEDIFRDVTYMSLGLGKYKYLQLKGVSKDTIFLSVQEFMSVITD